MSTNKKKDKRNKKESPTTDGAKPSSSSSTDLPSLTELLPSPWRTLDWSNSKRVKYDLRSLRISTPYVKCLRILVHGPQGAGKSSFINSIDSIFQERMTSPALIGVAGDYFTKKLHTYYIRGKEHLAFLPFALCDIIGLEVGQSEGVQPDDIISVLRDPIRDDYMFKPISPCSQWDPRYNSQSDRIHCLVYVIPADKVSWTNIDIFGKMKEVRPKAVKWGIPQVVVLTKVDEVCPDVANAINLVYRSKKIKEKIMECSNYLGVPMNCIFPVKNYSEEIQLKDDVDVLLLSALENILNFANDFVAVMAPPPAISANDAVTTCPVGNANHHVYETVVITPPVAQMTPYELDKPWRTVEWSKRNYVKNNLREFEISNPAVQHLRILVHGPEGAGKSSFINSIDSIFQERMSTIALAEGLTDRGFITALKTHYIKDQRYGSHLPFAFCDVPGLQSGHGEGVTRDDIISILKGHIRDGYMFNPISPCSESDLHFNRNPELSDKIHCLVSVVSAYNIPFVDDAILEKMKAVRVKAASLSIPQMTILTYVDYTCPEVAKDINLIYKSKKIRERMHDCSNRLGIPMNCIFPVKCYHEEIQLNNDVDVLLLSALTTILNFANDHVAEMAAMAPPVADVRGNSSQHLPFQVKGGTSEHRLPNLV